MKWFIRIVITLVGILIAIAIVIGGLPSEQRKKNFDELRVQQLQMIQSKIVYYFQSKNTVPEHLSELNKSPLDFTAPKDPETKSDYEYTKKNTEEFELCAQFTFSTKGQEQKWNYPEPVYPMIQYNWTHDAGRYCFTRKIDKDYLKRMDQISPPLAPLHY